ncbi:MAG: type II toxin-antitoxin system PemK/MazF family toxin [Planctomycetales bacterium]
MNEGDVFLTSLVQADGKVKDRPAVLLRQMPPFGDWLICGVSTQLHLAVPDFDELIDRRDDDFAGSGLKAPSVIRLGFLAVFPAARFIGVIGTIAPERHSRLLERLSDHLQP